MTKQRLVLTVVFLLTWAGAALLAQPFNAQITQAFMTLGLWPYDGSYTTASTVSWNATLGKFVPTAGGSGLTNFGTTSTDGLVLANTTAATSGVPLQMSPRLRWSGTVWDTDDSVSRTVNIWAEVVPVSGAVAVAGLRWWFDEPGVGAQQLGMMNVGEFAYTGDLQLPFGSYVEWGTAYSKLRSSTDGRMSIYDSSGTRGMEFNFGTSAPTLSSCGTGTIQSGSRHTAGVVTATGATSCTVNFTQAYNNMPMCVISLMTAPTTTPYISNLTQSVMTVSGLTAGDQFSYVCLTSVGGS